MKKFKGGMSFLIRPLDYVFRCACSFGDLIDSQVVSKEGENLMEDENVVEGSVGLVHWDVKMLSKVLKRMARQVSSVFTRPFEGIDQAPLLGQGKRTSLTFSAEEGQVELLSVMGDKINAAGAKFDKLSARGGEGRRLRDHFVGDVINSRRVFWNRHAGMDKLLELLVGRRIKGGDFDNSVNVGASPRGLKIKKDRPIWLHVKPKAGIL